MKIIRMYIYNCKNMGVRGLMKIFKTVPDAFQEVKLSSLTGKRIAIDISLISHQLVCGFSVHNTGRSHKEMLIYGLICKFNKFISNGILCVAVLDGKPSELKADTIEERKERMTLDSFYISDEIQESICEVLTTLGIPYIHSPSESDPVLSYLQTNNYVDYVLSDDSDISIYGCSNILLKQKGDTITIFNKDKFLQNEKLTQQDLVKLAVLLGNDYNTNPPKVGPVKAYDSVLNRLSYDDVFEKYKVNDDQLLSLMKTVDSYYKSSISLPELNLLVKIPDCTKVKELLENYNLSGCYKNFTAYNFHTLKLEKGKCICLSNEDDKFNKKTISLLKLLPNIEYTNI